MQPNPSPAASPCRPFSPASLSARRATRNDLNRALRLLRRSPAARAFMLTPPPASLDLSLLSTLATARPHFTISTDEHQRGSLPGRIALRYLGLPAFSDSDGLSGGLVVTTYASRTHPLHAPAVLAHVRVGRYVRDNATGDWCILTRNRRDRLTRLQYISTSDAGARERICLTCSSGLFDRGRLLDSVLFNCHDSELRVCTRCAEPLCACLLRGSPAAARHTPGLAALAEDVVREGAAEWLGTVRVTVVSNLSNNPALNVDETMSVRSSYTPTIDTELAAEMQRLAIIETATHSTSVPYPLTAVAFGPVHNGHTAYNDGGAAGGAAHDACMPDAGRERANTSAFNNAASTAAAFEMSQIGAADPTFDDVFTMEDTTEVANHFLILQESAISEALSETPMQPADPSTLPGGTDHCLEGMELESDDYSYFASSAAPSSAAAPPTDLLGDDAVANALASADMDNLFLPSTMDNLDKLADVETCTPASASLEAVDAVPKESAGKAPSAVEPSSPTQHEGRSGKRLKREAVESAETMSSLTLGSTGSGSSTKSATTSHASATDGSPFAEHSPVPSAAQSPQVPRKGEAAPNAPSIATADPTAASPSAPPQKKRRSAASTPATTRPQASSRAPTPPLPTHTAPCAQPGASQTASPEAVQQPVHRVAAPQMAPVAMPIASLVPFSAAQVSGIQNATAAPMTVPGLFHGAAMLGPGGAWMMAPTEAAAGGSSGAGACAMAAAAPRLAPRPKGMPNDGFIWQMGSVPVAPTPALAYAMPAQVARWQRLERERKAEERRKKNRQAAARSNARKKDVMDGYRAEIAAEKQKVGPLRAREAELRRENEQLKRRLGHLR